MIIMFKNYEIVIEINTVDGYLVSYFLPKIARNIFHF